MFLILLLYAPTTAIETNNSDIKCDGLIFQDVYYEREILVKNLGRPYNLVYHKYTGRLFLSHTIQTGSQIDFGIKSCHINSKQCTSITGVPGGYAIAYDSENDDLYFGGHDGIYKYKFMSTQAQFFAEDGKSIWGIFIRRNFYYIEYPSQKLFVYKIDKFVQVSEAVGIEILTFFISRSLEIYFSNRTALYKVDKANEYPVMLNDGLIVRQIIEDNYGDVYFCASDGIYMDDKPFHRVKRVAKIKQGFGMTFDERERVIYSDVSNIYRLNPSNNSIYCYDKLVYLKDEEI